MSKILKGLLLLSLSGILIGINGCRKCYKCQTEIGYFLCYKPGISDTIPWISNAKSFIYPNNDTTFSCEPIGFYRSELEGCDRNFLLRYQSFSNCTEK